MCMCVCLPASLSVSIPLPPPSFFPPPQLLCAALNDEEFFDALEIGLDQLEAEEEATRRERELEAQRTVGLLGLWRRGVRI